VVGNQKLSLDDVISKVAKQGCEAAPATVKMAYDATREVIALLKKKGKK
jgi:hypothetical protein